MKRHLLMIVLFLLMAPYVFAAQTYVIGEMFTTTTCGFCPPARSALADFYNEIEDYPFFIPLIWQGNGPHISPEYIPRRNLYGITGIPSCRFNGNVVVHGYSADAQYQRYVNAYNQVVTRNAPMEIGVRMELNDDDEIIISADVLMTANIDTPNNNIIFVLTYDLTGIMDPDYFASVKTYHAEAFLLDTEAQEGLYTADFPYDESWEMDRINAVVFVQSLNSENPIIHQAGQRSGRGMTSVFTSNVQQGPPTLHVQFSNNSTPVHIIDSFEWDLNGDGEIDSEEENPVFQYDEPGTYSVTLTVSDGVEKSVLFMEDYITVLEPDNVFGTISSEFKQEYSPYTIRGDVIVPHDSFLKIEQGVEVNVESSSITINGLFAAEGNIDEPIVFTSDTGWNGVVIEESDHANIIKNTIFSQAIDTPLSIRDSNVELFTNNIFANNGISSGGGAMSIEKSDFDIMNSLFVNNEGIMAGALHIVGSNVELVNNTIYHNSFPSLDIPHINNEDSYLQIRNCIIRGEGTAIISSGAGMTLGEYSNISGGFDGLFVIDEDPMFFQPSEGAGRDHNGLEAVWFLQEDSPSVDTGNPAAEYNDPEDPFNPGYALFPAQGSVRNDMGAYGGSGTSAWVFIEEDIFIEQPEKAYSINAYPNPFNPNVTISLANIPFKQNEPITLKVYDIRGTLVKTILDNEITNHTIFSWDGSDMNESISSSGVYMINFTSETISSGKKVILLK